MVKNHMSKLDILFINPNSSSEVYQELAELYTAIEPPTWALLLAESCRSKGNNVGILDTDALRLTDKSASEFIGECKPRLICFVVYGQNPNAGTTNMQGAIRLAQLVKEQNPEIPIIFVGTHSSALPFEVLAFKCVDIVLTNEGVYALHNLLKSNLKDDLYSIKGIGFKDQLGMPRLNPPECVVPQDRMDIDLPGYAWDLLPFKEKPLDLYRSHFWHANFDHSRRTPFVSIYTSVGCRFKCSFCMVNSVNRNSNSPDYTAADSAFMRLWSPDFITKEFGKLADMGVKTVRIADEMFFLDKRYFEPLLTNIINKEYKFNMWSYSRVDTVRPKYLDLFKRAGINWLALGIEAANQVIRREVTKGTFEEVDIREVNKTIHDHDINVIANYIFGFPSDTLSTMQETLDLSLELCTEMWNGYPCMALPGSPLYLEARQNNWDLPEKFSEYSFVSYDTKPLPTKYLSSAEVLAFRDEAWQTYFTYQPFLDLVKSRFGQVAYDNVVAMSKIKLKRKLLGD